MIISDIVMNNSVEFSFELLSRGKNLLSIEIDIRYPGKGVIWFQTKLMLPEDLTVVQYLQNLVRRLFVT